MLEQITTRFPEALILSSRGEGARARTLLEQLLHDPRCTLAVEALAKATLPSI